MFYRSPELQTPFCGYSPRLFQSSYQALLQASMQAPILLDGFAQAPAKVRATVTALLQRAPLTAFMQFVKAPGETLPSSQLQEVFTPTALQTVTAS